MKNPQEVLKTMLSTDKFTEWLGLKVDEVGLGFCKLHFTVREEMVNGFNNIHGGVLFSASDSAFAFACNSHGRISVALDVSISFTKPAKIGEILTVEVIELHLGHKTGLYEIKTFNQAKELVCLFKGTSYRSSKEV